MYALVTGGTGFLGLYIVEQLLARGDHVRVLCRSEDKILELLGVDVVLGDLRDLGSLKKACQGIETVFHTAAHTGISCHWKPYFEINTLGTIALLNMCEQQGVKKFVYTSSPSVVFDARNQINVDETAPYTTRWLAHYPQTKALAEQAVLYVNNRRGMLTCALRPHLIWGPRDRHLVPRLIQRSKNGTLKRVGDGTNMIDISYVENIATAHLQAADALLSGGRVAGNAYFVSQGEPVNCWEWADRVLALANLPKIQKSISFKTAWYVGTFLEMWYTLFRLKSEPLMTRFLAAELACSHWFNISRAKNDFGYTPIISTEEGFERLARELTEKGAGN